MTTTMNLTIINPSSSGVSSDQIYVSILGTDPTTNQFGYLDFTTGQMVTGPAFTYVSGTTSMTLKDIQAIHSTIAVPPVQSARIYFAIGQDFAPAFMVVSGPTASANNTTLFDKIEFDTHLPGSYNINGTSVDFYGISYSLSAVPAGGANPVTFGYTATRTEIITALSQIPASPATQNYGNTGIFQSCMIENSSREVLRVLSPKTMALTDWGPTQADYVARATLNSHFLDQYVNEHCWAPNRTFSFYDKDYPSQLNQIYGRVSADGLTLNLYTDAGMTQPYAVAALPRPSATWPNPDFNTPTNYQNTNSADVNGIDWGFLLIGNALGTGAAANWASDPAAMAITVSIDRGVMHLDSGTTAWVDSSKYYQGSGGGTSTEDQPILYYSSILHQYGLNGMAYVLSYDDVYGENPSIFFDAGAEVTVTLNSLESVTLTNTQ